jgi:type VI secretion system protein ImpM
MNSNSLTARNACSSPESALAAGWYGKIPCLGDFVSRRLPASLINAWDLWLQHAIAASRAELGDRWLDVYLRGPIWRFALMPGALPGNMDMWAGILMPSVDKVGRYFPLTIALRIEPRPGAMPAVFSAQSWYASLERIALAMLDMDAQPDDLDRNLSENPFPAPEPVESSNARELASWWRTKDDNPKTLVLPTEHSLNDLFDTAAENLLADTGSGRSFWWTVSPGGGLTRLRCFLGLPPDSHFASMLQDNLPEKDHAIIPTQQI